MNVKRFLCFLTLTTAGLGGATAMAQDADDAAELEEIVVTGSYLTRRSFDDAGSPVTALGEDDFKVRAPGGKMTDITQSIPFNFGAFTTVSQNEPSGETGGGTINLRGLGPAATLVLVNGRRQARMGFTPDGRTNLNTLVPSNMVERIEVLRDGASAIYGTDAVAGVANFLTKDDFEGFELSLDSRGTTDSFDWSSYSIGGLWGSQTDSTSFVAGVEMVKISPLRFGERPDQYQPNSNAGVISSFPFVPNVNVPLRDAGGLLTGTTTRVADPACASTPLHFISGVQCRFGFIPQFSISKEEERLNAMARYKVEFDSGIDFTGEFGFANVDTWTSSPGSTPIARFTPIVPGEHPANTYRAVDANGAALFAQDSDSDGVADRDATGVVILAANPTDPTSGIAFNEDVSPRFRPTFGPADQHGEETTFRLAGELNGDFNDRWAWNVAAVHAQSDTIRRRWDAVASILQDALNCEGGLSGTECYNPFGTKLTTMPNSPGLVDSFNTLSTDTAKTELTTADVVVSGDLLDMPSGALGLAVGAQYRVERLEFDVSDLNNIGALSFQRIADDFSGESDVIAFFAEVAVPLADNLDLSAAVRYEDTDGDFNSTDPKVSLSYRPTDAVSLRASYATSFLSPSLSQRFGISTVNRAVTDPLDGQTVVVPTSIVGSTSLEPQESDSYNIGATFDATEAFRISVDYWHFEFDGLLSSPSAQGLVNANPNDPNITRDPVTGEILAVNTPFFNASSLEIDGIDLSASYDFGGGRGGDFTAAIDVGYTTTYDLQAISGGATVDGIGRVNDDNFGTTLPQWKGTASLQWALGNHSASGFLRFYDEVVNDARVTEFAESQFILDVQYGYFFEGPQVSVAIGFVNLFDELADEVTDASTFVEQLQDPIGRRVFLKATKTF